MALLEFFVPQPGWGKSQLAPEDVRAQFPAISMSSNEGKACVRSTACSGSPGDDEAFANRPPFCGLNTWVNQNKLLAGLVAGAAFVLAKGKKKK